MWKTKKKKTKLSHRNGSPAPPLFFDSLKNKVSFSGLFPEPKHNVNGSTNSSSSNFLCVNVYFQNIAWIIVFSPGTVAVVGSFPLGQKTAERKPFGREQEPSGILLNGLFMATTSVGQEVSEVRAQPQLSVSSGRSTQTCGELNKECGALELEIGRNSARSWGQIKCPTAGYWIFSNTLDIYY